MLNAASFGTATSTTLQACICLAITSAYSVIMPQDKNTFNEVRSSKPQEKARLK